MILVTLGTQDKSFHRLLEELEKQIILKNIKEKVIVQAGFTKFESNNMEMFDLIEMDELNSLIKKADLIITHGGVGSILTALKYHKKVIAVARLKKYKEHTNDHQKQIVDIMYQDGYILKYEEGDDFNKILKDIKTFKPKEHKSNTDNIMKVITEFIETN